MMLYHIKSIVFELNLSEAGHQYEQHFLRTSAMAMHARLLGLHFTICEGSSVLRAFSAVSTCIQIMHCHSMRTAATVLQLRCSTLSQNDGFRNAQSSHTLA